MQSPTTSQSLSAPDERVILLAGQSAPIPYRLTRARRRSVAIQVDADGVRVRAPRWLSVRDIEAALIERSAWILKSCAWWRRHIKDVVTPEWREGAQILYRGQWLTLSLSTPKTGNGPLLERGRRKKTAAVIAHDLFGVQVFCAENMPMMAGPLEEAVHDWWWREAEALLLPQARVLADRIGRSVQSVRLSRARTQWGSCNAAGALRLNWRLILLPPHLAEDVVAHEVAHLCELNHSPRFWQVLEMLRPGSRGRRQEMAEWAGVLQR